MLQEYLANKLLKKVKEMQLKDIVYKILELQEKFLRYRLSKTIGIKNSSTRKRHYSNSCTLDLSAMADVERQELESML